MSNNGSGKFINAFYTDISATMLSSGRIGSSLLNNSSEIYIYFTAFDQMKLLEQDVKSEFINLKMEEYKSKTPLEEQRIDEHKIWLQDTYTNSNEKYLQDAVAYMLDKSGIKHNEVRELKNPPMELGDPVWAEQGFHSSSETLGSLTSTPYKPNITYQFASEKVPQVAFKIKAADIAQDISAEFLQKIANPAYTFTCKGMSPVEMDVYNESLKTLANNEKAFDRGTNNEIQLNGTIKVKPLIDVNNKAESSVKKLFNRLVEEGELSLEDLNKAVTDMSETTHLGRKQTNHLLDFVAKRYNTR